VNGLVIRPAEDDDMDDVASLLLAADDARVLSAERLRHSRRTRLARAKIVDVVAELDGVVVGFGGSGLDLYTSTESAGWASVTVGADRRRRGIGDALGSTVLDHLRAIGVTRATSLMRATEEGERWAQARGWSPVLRAPLIAVDPRLVPEPSPPDGFHCVAMSELTPEDAFEAVREAALDEPSAVPHDDFPFDDFERDWKDLDLDLEASTAVQDDAGRVAAFAFINVVGTRAQHGFTGTARAHRGRGLATAAKRRALRTVAARGVTRVTTSNAEQNAAMRAINRGLGFERIGEHVILGRDLERA